MSAQRDADSADRASTTTAPPGGSRRPRSRRWGRRGAWAALVVCVLLVAFSWWVEVAGTFEPPPLPEDHPAFGYTVVEEGQGLARCGPAWRHAGAGISEIYLTGDAVTRGFTMASLCRADMDAQEDHLFVELDRLLPGDLRRYVMRKGILFAFRDQQDYIADSYELECAAMVPALRRGPPRPHADVLPIFHRVLFYQSLYDIGQSMAEAGLVEAEIGCSSFAASGAATRGGGLVLGRNCDFEAGDVFDDRKLVFFVDPEGAQRYVCVSWSGMLGVLSGVNEHGLVVMLHAARTERTRWPRAGTPVTFLIRDAMLYDATIEDVEARVRANPEHAAALLVVAEAQTGRSAVIETDPDHTVVVPARDGVTVCTNTLRADVWQEDAVVRATRAAGSSSLRGERMSELVEAASGAIDAVTAAAILRDRRGVGDAQIGLGNRTAISALIAAHAVVYDGATGRLYVSRAPRGMGAFVAYDTARFFRRDLTAPSSHVTVRVPGEPEIAADEPGLATAVERGRSLLRDGELALARGDHAAALTLAVEAVELLDAAPDALLLEAEAHLAAGSPAAARAAAERALERQPVPGPETARLLTIARREAR